MAEAVSIEKRGNSYRVTVWTKPDPGTGKRDRVTKTTRTKAEARALEAELLSRLNTGGLVRTPAGLTMADLLKDWLAHVKNTDRLTTWENYTNVAEKHLLPILGAAKLADITPLDLTNLLARKLEEGKAPRTVKLIRFVAKAALGFAVDMQLLARNPADVVKNPKIEQKEMKAWTPQEARGFLEVAKGDRLYPLYVLALDTGARLGELLGLKWANVDLDGGIIDIRHALTKRRELTAPKTKRSLRKVDISARTVEVLRRWRKRQLEERLAAGPEWQETGFVFTTRTGTGMFPDNLDRNYHPIMRKAGVPEIRFHDLRHTVATLLLAAGGNPRVVSERLGHSNVGFTLQTYAHVLPGQQREAAEKLDKLLYGG